MAVKASLAKHKTVIVALVVAAVGFYLWKRHTAGAGTQAADTEVPLTPSPYFYSSPFGGAGGGGSVGGGTASNPTPSVKPKPPQFKPRGVDTGVIQKQHKNGPTKTGPKK